MAADPKDKSPDGGVFSSRHEFLQIFKKGAEFTEELLKENERLRYRLAELEPKDPTEDGTLVKELLDKVGKLQSDHASLEQRYKEVERENQNFARRYAEIENENNTLLNIYVASYQLHSTLDFDEVLNIIHEVVLNFVGAEVFSVGLVDETHEKLTIVSGEGAAEGASIPLGSNPVGDAVRSGVPFFADDMSADPKHLEQPAICVPLITKDKALGAILIYKFLTQKEELAPLDHELFTLLAGHAATAIFAAKLFTDSKRKLSTIQNFIQLVSS